MENKEVNIKGTNYYVLSNGDVITYNWKNTGRRAILKPAKDQKGYMRVGLVINGKLTTKKVHRLVASAFLENRYNKPQVNHIDGNKSNNDVSNLEWVTQSENKKHSFLIGLENNNGENNPFSKLRNEDVLQIRKLKSEGLSVIEISDLFKINKSTTRRIINRITWKHI